MPEHTASIPSSKDGSFIESLVLYYVHSNQLIKKMFHFETYVPLFTLPAQKRFQNH
jgi:hypothetical protein